MVSNTYQSSVFSDNDSKLTYNKPVNVPFTLVHYENYWMKECGQEANTA